MTAIVWAATRSHCIKYLDSWALYHCWHGVMQKVTLPILTWTCMMWRSCRRWNITEGLKRKKSIMTSQSHLALVPCTGNPGTGVSPELQTYVGEASVCGSIYLNLHFVLHFFFHVHNGHIKPYIFNRFMCGVDLMKGNVMISLTNLETQWPPLHTPHPDSDNMSHMNWWPPLNTPHTVFFHKSEQFHRSIPWGPNTHQLTWTGSVQDFPRSFRTSLDLSSNAPALYNLIYTCLIYALI